MQVEADMVVQGVQHVDYEMVKSYAQELRGFLEEVDFTESKTSLRSFVKRIVADGSKAKIQYRLPMPPNGRRTQSLGVLPIIILVELRGFEPLTSSV